MDQNSGVNETSNYSITENDISAAEIEPNLNQSDFISPDRRDVSKGDLIAELDKLDLSKFELSVVSVNVPSSNKANQPQISSYIQNQQFQSNKLPNQHISEQNITTNNHKKNIPEVNSLPSKGESFVPENRCHRQINNSPNTSYLSHNTSLYSQSINDSQISHNELHAYRKAKRRHRHRRESSLDSESLRKEIQAVKDEQRLKLRRSSRPSSKYSSSNYSQFSTFSSDDSSQTSTTTASTVVARYRRYDRYDNPELFIAPPIDTEVSIPMKWYSQFLQTIFETRFGKVYSQRYKNERLRNFIDFRKKITFFLGGIISTRILYALIGMYLE